MQVIGTRVRDDNKMKESECKHGVENSSLARKYSKIHVS